MSSCSNSYLARGGLTVIHTNTTMATLAALETTNEIHLLHNNESPILITNNVHKHVHCTNYHTPCAVIHTVHVPVHIIYYLLYCTYNICIPSCSSFAALTAIMKPLACRHCSCTAAVSSAPSSSPTLYGDTSLFTRPLLPEEAAWRSALEGLLNSHQINHIMQSIPTQNC